MPVASIVINAAISSGIVLLVAGAAVLINYWPVFLNADKTIVKRFSQGILEGFSAVTLNGLCGVWGVYYGFPSPFALSFSIVMLLSNSLHIKSAHTHISTRKRVQGVACPPFPQFFFGVFLVTFMLITALGPLRFV